MASMPRRDVGFDAGQSQQNGSQLIFGYSLDDFAGSSLFFGCSSSTQSVGSSTTRRQFNDFQSITQQAPLNPLKHHAATVH